MSKRRGQIKHAKKRAWWRYGLRIGEDENREISKLIQEKDPGVALIEHQTHRIGLFVVTWREMKLPVIYDRKRKVVVTFLPRSDSRVKDFLNKEKKVTETQEKISNKNITPAENQFIAFFEDFSSAVHGTAKEKGFWEKDGAPINPFNRDVMGNKLMHVVGELSEAHEITRKHEDFVNAVCEKPIDITALEEEFADTIIRLMDSAKSLKMDLGRAIVLKAKYNKTRPYMHGKQS